MLLYCLTDTAEDDTLLTEFLLEGSLHRHRVHDGIHGGAAQSQTLLQRNTEEAVGLIVNGYAKDVLNKLPMEFAVEAQKLLSVSLEGTVG